MLTYSRICVHFFQVNYILSNLFQRTIVTPTVSMHAYFTTHTRFSHFIKEVYSNFFSWQKEVFHFSHSPRLFFHPWANAASFPTTTTFPQKSNTFFFSLRMRRMKRLDDGGDGVWCVEAEEENEEDDDHFIQAKLCIMYMRNVFFQSFTIWFLRCRM